MVMGVIGWVVLGLIAGYLTGTLVNRDGERLPMNIGVGIVGAVVGGWLFTAFNAGAAAFSLWSLLVALAGALALLAAWHTFRRLAWRT